MYFQSKSCNLKETRTVEDLTIKFRKTAPKFDETKLQSIMQARFFKICSELMGKNQSTFHLHAVFDTYILKLRNLDKQSSDN